MKNKEIIARLNNRILGGLIVFILAVLVTGGSFFYCREVTKPVGGFGLIKQLVCGWPLWYWYKAKGNFNLLGGLGDLLFWFLVILGVWQMVKCIRMKNENKTD